MNRPPFEEHDPVGKIFNSVVAKVILEGLIDDERFVVEGTLIRSMAGHKLIGPRNTDDNDDDIDNDAHDTNDWLVLKGKKHPTQHTDPSLIPLRN